ncbi:MAG: hypothetical protein ACK5MY_03150 [Jhaorihella sp.]
MTGAFTDPERTRSAASKGANRDRPSDMPDFVRRRGFVAGPEGHAPASSEPCGNLGRSRHGRESGAASARVGGAVARRDMGGRVVSGPRAETGNHCFAARHPIANAFLKMIAHPAHRLAVAHRQASGDTEQPTRRAMAGAVFG